MKKVILSLCIFDALTGHLALAQQFAAKGLQFVAPGVSGKANVDYPAAGEIIYDYTDGHFYGHDTAVLNNWVDLSSSSISTTPTAPPTVQVFTATGTPYASPYQKNYTFIITSGNATAGATYTNNSVTFTVYATVAGATQVVMRGSGAPSANGTLTKATGTGDSTLTFSQVLAPLYLKVRMIGGGGGGGGGGTGGGAGGSGSASTFYNSTFMSAGGGSGGYGASSSMGGAGGTSSISGPIGIALNGGGGASGQQLVTSSGGNGGSSAFGGAGIGPNANGNAGGAGVTNTGGGGGGASGTSTAAGGGGGGSGGYVEVIISSPLDTYAYAVGGGGSNGATGSPGASGGAGGSGLIEVTEFYK